MHAFAERGSMAAAATALQGPAIILPLARILTLVERRLAWYGFRDWRIRDVVIGAEAGAAVPPVTVVVRGPGGGRLEMTLGRNGAVSRTALTPARPAAPARAGVRAQSLKDRAAEALAFYRESARAYFQPPLRELPTSL